jgi:hypothetical protein
MSDPHWRLELAATAPVHRSVDRFPPLGSMWNALIEGKGEGQWLPRGSHVAKWRFPVGQSDMAEAWHRMPWLPSVLAPHSVVKDREERERGKWKEKGINRMRGRE